MVDENNSKAGFDERPATEAQVQLVLQLYKECDYKRAYSEQELAAMNRAEISKHVAFVKEYKNVQQQLALQNGKVNGFDKVSFAMIYKLCFNAWVGNERYGCSGYDEDDFISRVKAEYALFRKCLQEAKTAGGGLQ